MIRNSILELTDFDGIGYECTCHVKSPRNRTFQYPTIRYLYDRTTLIQ